jgi:hypothetical protein
MSIKYAPHVALFVALSVVAPQAQQCRPCTLPPVDEAHKDASLIVFRERLLYDIRRRDADRVTQAIAVDILQGHKSVAASLQTAGSDTWLWLERALTLGGGFMKRTNGGQARFCAPYVYATFPKELPLELQQEGGPWVLIGADVPVHQSPSSTSPVRLRLSHAIVRIGDGFSPADPPRPDWLEIRLEKGMRGWVAAGSIRDPADTHVCLTKRGNEWFITDIAKGGPEEPR